MTISVPWGKEGPNFVRRLLPPWLCSRRFIVFMETTVCIIFLFAWNNAHSQVFETYQQSITNHDMTPAADGIIQGQGDNVSGNYVTVRPLSTLPFPDTIAIYKQDSLPTPTLCDVSQYEVFRAVAISSFRDSLAGTMRLIVKYQDDEFTGSSSELKFFRFDYVNGLWTTVPATVLATIHEISTLINTPALYGIGHPNPTHINPSVPLLTPWGIAIFLAMLFVLGVFALRRRTVLLALLAVTISLATMLAGIPTIRRITSQPEVTNPGNKPINHTEKVGIKKEAGKLDGKDVVYHTPSYKIWKYKGSGDPTNADNWKVDPGSNPRYTGTDQDPGIAGAERTQQNYDNDQYPFFDCAGYALRDSKFIPLDPNSDGKIIIDNEYNPLDGNPKTAGGFRQGDIVTYKKDGKITHYAVVDEVDNDGKIKKCKSKWGKGYIMKHDINSVPNGYGPADKVYCKK
ncbi:MAG: hypothetical protein HY033_13905 [Ignavibacteriae bacterium]|nr:hypothetical protein [Ignavibacteriota bacterium]